MSSYLYYELVMDVLHGNFFHRMFNDGNKCDPLDTKQRLDKNVTWLTDMGIIHVTDCRLGGCVIINEEWKKCRVEMRDGSFYLKIPVEETDA